VLLQWCSYVAAVTYGACFCYLVAVAFGVCGVKSD
jgi:hypothetical protein